MFLYQPNHKVAQFCKNAIPQIKLSAVITFFNKSIYQLNIIHTITHFKTTDVSICH